MALRGPLVVGAQVAASGLLRLTDRRLWGAAEGDPATVSIRAAAVRRLGERPVPSRPFPSEDVMTATLTTTTRRGTGSVVGAGLAATAVAALATSTVAAAGSAAGISLDVSGAPIPVSGFAVLTVVFSLVGVVLAAVLARRARRPRSTFVRTTGVLTALSLVPDVVADATTDTRVLLMVTHLVAAAIVVPAVARRLPTTSRR